MQSLPLAQEGEGNDDMTFKSLMMHYLLIYIALSAVE